MFIKSLLILMVVLILLATSCGCSNNFSTNKEPKSSFRLEPAFPDANGNNIYFSAPLDLQNAGETSNRLFVVEKNGLIRLVIQRASESNEEFNSKDNKKIYETFTFLDIREKVKTEIDMGLLGLAFHPDFATNGYFYIHYDAPDPQRSVISRFSISKDNPNEADKNSEVVLLEIPQPYVWHNGGQILFGLDGYLYIAMGDGGPPNGKGISQESQNLSNLLGTIIRIDVNNPDIGKNYGIPNDNPFFGNSLGYREEIYAYGLRNPWKMSFDPVTGNLLTGDVGEITTEEIDIIIKGRNYGWPIMEGSRCFSKSFIKSFRCNKTGLELPIWEYGHSMGRAIIGGFVYRGALIPDLYGKYIYGDLNGTIWALSYDGINKTENIELKFNTKNIPEHKRQKENDDHSKTGVPGILSFGLDNKNEIYVCSTDGMIYRLEMDKHPDKQLD